MTTPTWLEEHNEAVSLRLLRHCGQPERLPEIQRLQAARRKHGEFALCALVAVAALVLGRLIPEWMR